MKFTYISQGQIWFCNKLINYTLLLLLFLSQIKAKGVGSPARKLSKVCRCEESCWLHNCGIEPQSQHSHHSRLWRQNNVLYPVNNCGSTPLPPARGQHTHTHTPRSTISPYLWAALALTPPYHNPLQSIFLVTGEGELKCSKRNYTDPSEIPLKNYSPQLEMWHQAFSHMKSWYLRQRRAAEVTS